MTDNEKETIPKEEQLNKEEFRQIIPHLEYNQLLLIEIKCSDGNKWQNLFSGHHENRTLTKITCNACLEDVPVEKFEKHIRSTEHLGGLEKLENFYHPLYTSERKSPEISEEVREGNIQKANALSAQIKRINRSSNESYNTVVSLYVEDLLGIQFRYSKGGKWINLIKIKGAPHKRGKYNCVLCNKYCLGLIPLNDHLKGASHRSLQLKVNKLKSENYANVTKHCQLSYNPGKNLNNTDINTDVKDTKEKEKEAYEKFKKKLKTETLPEKSDSESKDLTLANGLVGVEYVVQIKKFSQPGEFSYVCCLCNSDIVDSAVKMEKHLTSYHHRLAYCKLHYSDTIENFRRIIFNCGVNLSLVMPFVLERIARGIDEYHGYGTPHTTTEKHFEQHRKQLIEEVEGLPHACQEFGPSFSNVVTAQEIRDFRKKPNASENKEYSEDIVVRFNNRNKSKYYLNMRRHISRKIVKPKVLEKDIPISTRTMRRKKRSRSKSSDRISLKRRSSSREQKDYGSTNVWSVYRDHISLAAIELESKYLGYRKQPDQHPQYDQEWNSFWRRRKEELILEGKNYRSYNFQPEWTTYFRQRLEQMFGEDLQKSKLTIRRRLNIPEDVEEDSVPTSQFKAAPISVDTGKVPAEKTWHETSMTHRTEDERPTVIHMLRLMTALEDYLGNLGPKILELLTTAVSLEKIYPAHSLEFEKQIFTSYNYKLLKTAVEKLKSKIYADLIEGNILNSFKRVIVCSENILTRVEKMGWANESEINLNVNNETTQIQKLIEVLQEKKAILPSLGKKSLSDALMEVISQKKVKESPNAVNNSVFPTVKQSTQLSSNIPSNYYSGMQTDNVPNYLPNNSFGRGNSNMNFTNQIGNSSIGYSNHQQWPDYSAQHDYASFNPNSDFKGTYPNVSNNRNSNWRR